MKQPDWIWEGLAVEQSTEGMAIFSPGGADSGVYRYYLSRLVHPDNDGNAIFIMLNPSTADAFKLDPTIKRCLAFASAWNCRRLIVLNLFALRSTDPEQLRKVGDPVGPDNDRMIDTVLAQSADRMVIAAWGFHAAYLRRGRNVADRLLRHGIKLQHLGLTGSAFPRHPLYVSRDTIPQPFTN